MTEVKKQNSLFDDDDADTNQEYVPTSAEPAAAEEAKKEEVEGPEIVDLDVKPRSESIELDKDDEEKLEQEVKRTASAPGERSHDEEHKIDKAPLSDRSAGVGSTSTTSAADRLRAEADHAKHTLMGDIQALNSQLGGSRIDLTELEDPLVVPYTVSEPNIVNNVPMYTVKGKNKDGEDFEVQRRFTEFATLREALVIAWCGFYVPFLPDKSYTRPNEPDAIEERRQLLQRFLRELAQFNFIIGSKEFDLFAKPGQGEVTKPLQAMIHEKPGELLAKYQANFPNIQEANNSMEMSGYREQINVFMVFLKKALDQLDKQKKEFKTYADQQTASTKATEKLYETLTKFEEEGVSYLANMDTTAQIFTSPQAKTDNLQAKVETAISTQKNAFQAVWIFLKGEILDVKGMRDALAGRDKIIEEAAKCQEKIVEKKGELESMSLGKTTMKSFFKTKKTIEKDILKYQERIDELSADHDGYEKLIEFVTTYQGKFAIKKFKALKQASYFRMLNHFSVREISNATLMAELYNYILDLNQNI